MNAPAPPSTSMTDLQPKRAPSARWHQRILSICFIIFAFEVGLFLLIFPWMPSWDLNWVPLQSPVLGKLWMSPHFRGVLSGVGLLNIYVAFVELFRQLRSFFK